MIISMGISAVATSAMNRQQIDETDLSNETASAGHETEDVIERDGEVFVSSKLMLSALLNLTALMNITLTYLMVLSLVVAIQLLKGAEEVRLLIRF